MTAYGRSRIEQQIFDELKRARSIHGEQDHLPDLGALTHSIQFLDADLMRRQCQTAFAIGQGSWAHILLEEVWEALDEARAGNTAALREELIQVGAMVLGWVKAIDGRDVA